jgi:CheY-like chemotaxis protein
MPPPAVRHEPTSHACCVAHAAPQLAPRSPIRQVANTPGGCSAHPVLSSSGSPSEVRVLLADDDVHVRSALRLLLEQEPDLCIVGESTAAPDLADQIARTQPGLILLDWELPGLRADGFLARLRVVRPQVRLIALSGRPEQRRDALEAGADAFICKGDSPEALISTVRALQ